MLTPCIYRLSFATYLLAMLLYIFNIRQGAWFTLLTGLLMVFACFAFGVIIINDPKLRIPFANEEQGAVLIDPHFGWSWWLALVTGVVTFFLGILILILDFFLPRQIAIVFHQSILEDDELFYPVSLQCACIALTTTKLFRSH